MLCNPDICLFFRRGIALAALGGPIYAIGGLDDNSCFNDVERYDIESDSWSSVAPMNTPRGGVGSVAVGVKLRGTKTFKYLHLVENK